jgi:endonuclease/exonuclease/phosphatase (EEP) superfamily protein YafD
VLVRYTTIGYSALLYGLWGVQWLIDGRDPFVGWIRSMLYLLILPTVPLLLLSVFFRRRLWTLAFLPPVVIFLVAYGVFFAPRAQTVPVDGSDLSILTFNIQVPENEKLTSIVKVIEESEADVVAIQELNQTAADEMAMVLSTRYPYQALHPQEYAPAGQGLLSRYPIVEETYWRYSEYDWSFGHQRVVLEIDGDPVVILNTHPVPFYTPARGLRQDRHLRVLVDVVERTLAETVPVVLLGDFNVTDQSNIYRKITDHYTDAYRAVGRIGFGFTFPADRRWLPPLVRMDFIFYSDAWTGVSALVLPHAGGSDHRPVLARLIPPQIE